MLKSLHVSAYCRRHGCPHLSTHMHTQANARDHAHTHAHTQTHTTHAHYQLAPVRNRITILRSIFIFYILQHIVVGVSRLQVHSIQVAINIWRRCKALQALHSTCRQQAMELEITSNSLLLCKDMCTAEKVFHGSVKVASIVKPTRRPLIDRALHKSHDFHVSHTRPVMPTTTSTPTRASITPTTTTTTMTTTTT